MHLKTAISKLITFQRLVIIGIQRKAALEQIILHKPCKAAPTCFSLVPDNRNPLYI